MPYVAGQSGNPNGRPKKGTALTDRLRVKMAKRADELAETLIGKALGGDMQAIKEIFDRMEGKPAQSMELTGDPEAPLQVVSAKPLDPDAWAKAYGKD